jgi:galactokinase
MYDSSVVENSIATHSETYGTAPTAISYAPGRIEVLGNHTDYNEGTVLSLRSIWGIASAFRNRQNPGSASQQATCTKLLSLIRQTARGSTQRSSGPTL